MSADGFEQWQRDQGETATTLVDGDEVVRGLSDEEGSVMDIWELLEQEAPAGCEAVQDLYSWSLNYDASKGPFALYLDLLGWSDDNLGEPIYSLKDASLGYLELDKLATALSAYADRPHDVREYVDALMEAEAGSD